MKQLLIGSLVGAVILFIWQFLSWGLMDLHGSQMDYHPNQDAVLEAIEQNLDEGTYFIPRTPRDASSADQQAYFEGRMGKPWALVSYYKSLEGSYADQFIRGFLLDFIAALLLAWILLQFKELTIKKAVLASIAVGLIGYLTITYLSDIYFPENTWPDLLDAFVQWGIVGAWLGWWLPRN